MGAPRRRAPPPPPRPSPPAPLVAHPVLDGKTRLADRLLGGDHGELDEAAHPARFLALDPLLGMPVDDFACHLAGIARRVEGLDPPYSRAAGLDRLPGSPGRMPERSHRAGPRNDHPAQHCRIPPPSQRRQATAQAGPLPQLSMSAVAPFFSRPSRTASWRATKGAATNACQ